MIVSTHNGLFFGKCDWWTLATVVFLHWHIAGTKNVIFASGPPYVDVSAPGVW